MAQRQGSCPRTNRLWACLALFLVLATVAWTRPPRHLLFASSMNNPPYEFVDALGRPAGYVNEIVRAVAKEEDLDVEIRPMPWKELREAFARGEVDCLTGMVFSEERAKTMEFTIPHSFVPYILITRKTETRISSERDLAGRDVEVLGGSIMAEHLASLGIPFRAMPSHEASILELASGRGDAAIVPEFTFMFFCQNRGISNLRANPCEIFPTKRCFAVHLGDNRLLAQLNEGLFLLKQNGTLDAIYARNLGALEGAQVPFALALKRSSKLLLPIVLALGLAGALAWSFALKRMVTARTKALEQTNRALGAANTALAEASQVDALTGLFNRRFLDLSLPTDVLLVQRSFRTMLNAGQDPIGSREDLIIYFLDLDHFKQINDIWGHQAGDAVLVQLARALKATTRATDSLVRWGGEEFLLVARRARRSMAPEVAQNLLELVRNHPFQLPGGEQIHLTISIGFTALPMHPLHPDLGTWQQALEVADQCLYAAKSSGRNRWVGALFQAERDPAPLGALPHWTVAEALKRELIHVHSSDPDFLWPA